MHLEIKEILLFRLLQLMGEYLKKNNKMMWSLTDIREQKVGGRRHFSTASLF